MKVPVSSSNGLVLIMSPSKVSGGQLRAQHSIGKQSQAAQVREPRALVQAGEVGYKQLWRNTFDGQIVANRFLQAVAGQRSTEPELKQVKRLLAEQRDEPQRVDARSIDDKVEAVDGFE